MYYPFWGYALAPSQNAAKSGMVPLRSRVRGHGPWALQGNGTLIAAFKSPDLGLCWYILSVRCFGVSSWKNKEEKKKNKRNHPPQPGNRLCKWLNSTAELVPLLNEKLSTLHSLTLTCPSESGSNITLEWIKASQPSSMGILCIQPHNTTLGVIHLKHEMVWDG